MNKTSQAEYDRANQCCSPDPKDRARQFAESVRHGDRVSVSKVNALGEWDTEHYSVREVEIALSSKEGQADG